MRSASKAADWRRTGRGSLKVMGEAASADKDRNEKRERGDHDDENDQHQEHNEGSRRARRLE